MAKMGGKRRFWRFLKIILLIFNGMQTIFFEHLAKEGFMYYFCSPKFGHFPIPRDSSISRFLVAPFGRSLGMTTPKNHTPIRPKFKCVNLQHHPAKPDTRTPQPDSPWGKVEEWCTVIVLIYIGVTGGSDGKIGGYKITPYISQRFFVTF